MSQLFPEHSFLTGHFAPISFEADAADLPIRGELPKDLGGTLYRNGPNPQFAPRDSNYHPFGGDGMVHAFHIEDGRVSYRNRWVQTPRFLDERAAHCALYGTWGNPMSADPSVRGKDSNIANTNVVWHAGKLMALQESYQPFALDPDTLASQGYWDFAGALKTGRFTAHPKMDPETGEMVFFAYNVGGRFTTTIAYGFVDRTGRLTRLETFEAPYSALVHDFLVTRNYLLFPVLPLTFSLERVQKGAPPLGWEPEKGGYVGVVRRDAASSTMRWFRCDACFVPHGMNAYEDGNKIVSHVMQFDEMPSLDPSKPGDPAKTVPRLHRWTFNLDSATDGFVREPIDDLPADFPRLDERFALNPYRYGYLAAMQKGDSFDMLVRFDLKTGMRTTYGLPGGDALSEPIFVPRSSNSAEGDGYLLATIHRGAEKRGELAIFDAATLEDGPIALAQLSHRIPLSLHGNWRNIVPQNY